MTIIYTYKKPKYQILKRPTDQRDWITRSIESARKVGYTNIELYTDDTDFSKGLDVDKVHYITDDYEIWDSFKIWVLENRNDDYFLSDNDVIYYNKIPFDKDIDIHFDAYEILSWGWAYKSTMEYLRKNKIFDGVDFWSYKQLDVINIGILKINNMQLKSEYIKYFKELYKISNNKVLNENGQYNGMTQILSQYLLTLLVNKNNNTIFNYSGRDWSKENPYYKHYAGNQKLRLKKDYLI